MSSNQYQAFLRAKVKGAIEEAKAASSLTHQGVKGTVLEILISRLFRPLLPSDIGIGTGQIIEQYNGKLSPQIDIVLYDKSILPPALYDEVTGIFPVEAVLYAIEVKTTLNAAELAKAHETAKELSGFGYLPGLFNSDGSAKHHKIEKVRSIVFSLNSNLTGKRQSEAARYEKIYKGKGDLPYIRALCVAGREYWYDNGECWVSPNGKDEYDEVLTFMGGVTNTYKGVAASRNSPLLGNYIISNNPARIGPITKKINRIKIICMDCGFEARFKPDLGTLNVTINSQINCPSSCPKCGGTMKSKPGTYEVKGGELVQDYASFV